MRPESYDVVVVGGGLGGVAAAKTASERGLTVLLTEETEWIGGQLTSQAVPPDEHPWIESFGRTRSFAELRQTLRGLYRPIVRLDLPDDFNPGGGWVSKICARPDMWHRAICDLISDQVSSGRLTIRLHTILNGGAQLSTVPHDVPLQAPTLADNRILEISLIDLQTQQTYPVRARYFIDATEIGDLLPLTGTQYALGNSSKEDLADPSASPAHTRENQQAITLVFAMSRFEGDAPKIEKPENYDSFRAFQPTFWPGPLFGLQDLDPTTNLPRTPPLPLFSQDWRCWFKYRQIVNPANHDHSTLLPTTIVNWPQNDYFISSVVEVEPKTRWARLQNSKAQSASFLYYLQNECDPSVGLSTGYLGTDDGFALTPYIRESRRIIALETVTEPDVSAAFYPGQKVSRRYTNSVGVGSYRIDLHPSTQLDPYIDLATLPFEIPLGAMIPVKTKNLIPACKNIGTTHITNGCYRLHPVEWNIGEVAGALAAFCMANDRTPQEVHESSALTKAFQDELLEAGVELSWPQELM